MNILAFLVFALSTIVTLSVDIYLPAIPVIKEYFASGEQITQMSFGLGFLACSVGGLIFGPLSDRIGRRPVIIATAGLTALGCFLCAYSTSIYMFNFARFIQCIGVGANWVLVYAILAESYDESKSAIMVSYMGTLHTATYIIAPILGGKITSCFGWEWCFLFVAFLLVPLLFIIIKFFPETIRDKSHHSLLQTYTQFIDMIKNPYFMTLGLVLSLTIGALLVPFSSLPEIFKRFGIYESSFGLFLGVIPVAETLTTFLTRPLLRNYGLDFVLKSGLVTSLIGGIAFFLVILFVPGNPYAIMASLALFSMSLPMMFPPVIAKCLQVFPDRKGTASALLSSFRYLIIGLCAILGSGVYDGTLLPASICMMFISALAVMMWKISVNKAPSYV